MSDNEENPKPPGIDRRKFLAGAGAAAALAGLWAGKKFLQAPASESIAPPPTDLGSRRETPLLPDTAANGTQPDRTEATPQKPEPATRKENVAAVQPTVNVITASDETTPAQWLDFLLRLSFSPRLPVIQLDARGLLEAPGNNGFLKMLDMAEIKGGNAVYFRGPEFFLEGKRYRPYWKLADSNGYIDRDAFKNAADALAQAYSIMEQREAAVNDAKKQLEDYKQKWSGTPEQIKPLHDANNPDDQRKVLEHYLGQEEAAEYLALAKLQGMASDYDSTNRMRHGTRSRNTIPTPCPDIEFFLGPDLAEEYARLSQIPKMFGNFSPHHAAIWVDEMNTYRHHLRDVLELMRERKKHLPSLSKELDKKTGVGNPMKHLQAAINSARYARESLWAMRGREAQLKAIADGATDQATLDSEMEQLAAMPKFLTKRYDKAILDILHTNETRQAISEINTRLGEYPKRLPESKSWISNPPPVDPENPLMIEFITYNSREPIPTLEQAPAERARGGR